MEQKKSKEEKPNMVTKSGLKHKTLILTAATVLTVASLSNCSTENDEPMTAPPQRPIEKIDEKPALKPIDQFIAEYAELAQVQRNHIAFDVISNFEGTGKGDLKKRFGVICGIKGEFSVGLWQCNADTLNSILASVFQKSPAEAKAIFGKHYEPLKKILTYNRGNCEEAKRVVEVLKQYWIDNDVKTMSKLVSKAMSTDEGIAGQLRDMNYRHSQAVKICDEYGLSTVYGEAAMLDLCVQYGIGGAKKFAKSMAKAEYNDDKTKLNKMVTTYPKLARTKVIISFAGGYNKDYDKVINHNIMQQRRLSPEVLIEDLHAAGYEFDEEAVRVQAIAAFAFQRPDKYMEQQAEASMTK